MKKIALGPKVATGFRSHVDQMLSMSDAWLEVTPIEAKVTAWRPSEKYVVITGDLTIDGNVVIGTGKHDDGVVIVTGAITCTNLIVAPGFSLACAGDVTASEAIVAELRDSTTYVAGKVKAALVASGGGGWLTVFDAKQLTGAKVFGYTMVGGKPLRPTAKLDAKKLVVKAALDDEDLDGAAALKLLAKGAAILL